MAPSSLQHRRTHNLLLVTKFLNQRDAASPFTLVLDSLEQSGTPLQREYLKRAKALNVKIIFVSFETLRQPPSADVLVHAWKQSLQAWQKEVVDHLRTDPTRKKLLVFDSLNSLSATQRSNLPAVLSSFLGPTSSILAFYHKDIPQAPSTLQDSYSPSALTLLLYLATTIFHVHGIENILARKQARDRNHVEPVFGLAEGAEGILQSLNANGKEGIVLGMEHRRKSGRGVREWYFLTLETSASAENFQTGRSKGAVTLLEDHPRYRTAEELSLATQEENVAADTTFELGLTEKQRRDREGVVLPYFDAQKGGGEGGRILYDMGEEDDFDEEEDEI